MAPAVVIIYIILTITTTSWFEPVLFLSVLGIRHCNPHQH